jgi:hypothetical protein
MLNKDLEYRMYGLVPFNISPIQQAIQYGHAVVEYGLNVKNLPPHQELYENWARNHKTFIILNGGTTNNNPERLGTLNQHLATLNENGVITSEFYEPDLNDALTAVVFLVDERVFNKELYPDLDPIQFQSGFVADEEYRLAEFNEWKKQFGEDADKIAFLRYFLKQFRLA